MTEDESGQLGRHAASIMLGPIESSMAIPGINRVFWWGGFLSALAVQCEAHLGPEANLILQGTVAEALKNLPARKAAS